MASADSMVDETTRMIQVAQATRARLEALEGVLAAAADDSESDGMVGDEASGVGDDGSLTRVRGAFRQRGGGSTSERVRAAKPRTWRAWRDAALVFAGATAAVALLFYCGVLQLNGELEDALLSRVRATLDDLRLGQILAGVVIGAVLHATLRAATAPAAARSATRRSDAQQEGSRAERGVTLAEWRRAVMVHQKHVSAHRADAAEEGSAAAAASPPRAAAATNGGGGGGAAAAAGAGDASGSDGSSTASLFERVDTELVPEGEYETAAKLLDDALAGDHKGDPDVLWRRARVHYLHAKETLRDQKDKQLPAFKAGLECARQAVDVAEDNADAHKYYAILVNEVGQLSDKKTLINAGQEFQKHTLRAMELRPRDDALTHMLARFYFEVAGIDWFTRKLAGAIFGKVPEASYTDALKLFQEAEEYNPGWVMNKLFIAKAHAKAGNKAAAKAAAQEVVDMPAKSEEDRQSVASARKMLARL